MTDFPTDTTLVTHPERDEGPRKVRRRRVTNTVSALLLTLLVGSAVLDWGTGVDVWGVSSDRIEASGGGYELEVRYPTVSRPALASPFDIEVRRDGGFEGPVDIAISSEYLEMWDFQAFYPAPSGETAAPDSVTFTFDRPEGDALRVFLDARIQPSEQSGRDGWVAVLDSSGEQVAVARFHTAVRP